MILLHEAHGCSTAYVNCELRFPQFEKIYLDRPDVNQLVVMADAHQSLSTDRGLATTVAELIAGKDAIASVDLDYVHMRRLVYHEFGRQQFNPRLC